MHTKGVHIHKLCVSVPFIILINILVENFKRKIPHTFNILGYKVY